VGRCGSLALLFGSPPHIPASGCRKPTRSRAARERVRPIHHHGGALRCRPTPRLPAATAARRSRSPAASKSSTLAAALASPPDARTAAPNARPTARAVPHMGATRPTVGAGATRPADAAVVRCLPLRAPAVARRPRFHSSHAATSPSTARPASSSVAGVGAVPAEGAQAAGAATDGTAPAAAATGLPAAIRRAQRRFGKTGGH